MKTLVLFGSPRKNGHTKAMLDLLLENIGGEYEIIDAYNLKEDIKPCNDCRYCWENNGCIIKDGMQDIYKKIEECDNLVLASPIYFFSITGKLKLIIDRFQPYWASLLRGDFPSKYRKTGSILMVGGAKAFENQFLGGELVLKRLLEDMKIKFVGEVTMSNSDRESLEQQPQVKKQILDLADKIIELNKIDSI